MSHLSLRPGAGHHQHPSGPFSYGAGSPAELASNLQHLQHLHSVQQQIAAAAAAAAAAAGASNYWTSLKGSALSAGNGRESSAIDQHQPSSWRYDSQAHHGAPLSSSPMSGKASYLSGGIEAANPVALLGHNKRKRSTVGSDDADDHDRCQNSAASFNHDGKLITNSFNRFLELNSQKVDQMVEE